ncbi:type 1 glutamine amidotransferase domain-containing protein [Flavobacterium sp. F-65]|jgi:putative intracellular protease/amidase|uniref:Type 1 glutamine amidotransferase domain-containing protein n=1 Tax=Flavobacterium pisciphilum TaxID=2893755 RepID=A0ABS8MWV0_9FLAO|nr:type 1 glutamine amidotransferase domain-containing protein [Flavobacterium sp. F-65]MCC9073250.1 type 1 glutamine amidotransferase domain-containing protein [Flavobacterium sp. F-65]
MHKFIPYLAFLFLLSSCSFKHKNKEKILFVTSNQHTYGNTDLNAANHFAEIVLAYDVFIKNGYKVDFVSPNGGAIPIGYITTSDSIQKRYLYDNHFMSLLRQTKSPEKVKALEYKAIYYVGGGAAMFGIAENIDIQNIAKEIFKAKGIISSVCHGTAGLIHLKDEQGAPLYLNRKISGYPDLFENKSMPYYQTFPFSIENSIKENKGNFVYSTNSGDAFIVVDGNFITGQDPSSAAPVAKKVIETIQNK